MTKSKNNNTFFLLLLLLVWVSAAVSLSLWLRPRLLLATFLFWGVPAVYLSMLRPRMIGRALLFSLAAAFTFGLVIDRLGFMNHVWATPQSVANFRLFAIIPIENPLWAALYAYSVVMLYEVLSRNQPRRLGKHAIVMVIGLALLAVVTQGAITLFPVPFAHIAYMYVLFGILFFAVPTALFLWKSPGLLPRFLQTTALLLPVAFANEVVALRLGHWNFPGTEYVGRLTVFGANIPFEEMFFFIITGPLAILTYYVCLFRETARRS